MSLFLCPHTNTRYYYNWKEGEMKNTNIFEIDVTLNSQVYEASREGKKLQKKEKEICAQIVTIFRWLHIINFGKQKDWELHCESFHGVCGVWKILT